MEKITYNAIVCVNKAKFLKYRNIGNKLTFERFLREKFDRLPITINYYNHRSKEFINQVKI